MQHNRRIKEEAASKLEAEELALAADGQAHHDTSAPAGPDLAIPSLLSRQEPARPAFWTHSAVWLPLSKSH